jgi:hypothetical protein
MIAAPSDGHHGEAVEHGDAVGFGPKPDHASLRECRILDRKQRFAIKNHVEARSLKLDTQRVPLVGGHRGLYAVATLAADNIQRAASAVDGLVEHHIVFKGIGADDVVIVGVLRTPDNTTGAVLRPGNGFEFHLDEAVADAGVLLEGEWKGGVAGLFEDGSATFILLNRPLGCPFTSHGQKPSSRSGSHYVVLKGRGLCG